jgi:membrane-associated phospholipid phosphatase
MNARRLGFDLPDFILGSYLAVILAIVALYRGSLPDPADSAVNHLMVALIYMGGIRVLARREAGPMAFGIFRSLGLCVSIPFLFQWLGNIVPYVNPRTYERELLAIDRTIFGTDPIVWMERILHPVAVDVMQVVYLSYYPLFLVGLVLLYRKEFQPFSGFMSAVIMTTTLCFLGYFLVPVRSPYFAATLPELADAFAFTVDLPHGAFGARLAQALHNAEQIKVDCFPSGHTAGAVMVMTGLWKWRRPWFWWIAPLALALIFSTVYLRYHYVVDLFAGALVGFGAVHGSHALATRFYGDEQDDRCAMPEPREVAG